MKCGVDKFCLGATSACCIHGMHPGRSLIDKPESVKVTQQENSTGKDILPEICIICKKLENYYTDPAS